MDTSQSGAQLLGAVADPAALLGGASTPSAEFAPAAERAPYAGNFARNTWAIARKELGVYFTTPIAYVLFAILLLILGFVFVVSVLNYIAYSGQAQAIAQYNPQALDQLNFTDLIFTPLMNICGTIFLFILPFLTMRLIAEEKRQSTFQLLMTSPLRTEEIVLGKFLSSLLLVFFALALTLVYPLMLNLVADGSGIEWQTAAVSYLGLFLLASALMSMGLFISSLTESQVVAALISFGLGLVMWLLGWASSVADGFAKDAIEYVALLPHLRSFLKGALNLADVSYFLSLTFLGLFLTRSAIERSRW